MAKAKQTTKNPPIVQSDALIETKQPHLLIRRSKLDKLDMDLVTEVYATGAPHFVAAKALGVSVAYWKAVRNGTIAIQGVDYSALLAAIEKGGSMIAMETLTNLRELGKKQALPAMTLANQPHILDFSPKKEVQHSGTLTIKFEESTGLDDPIDITPDEDGMD